MPISPVARKCLFDAYHRFIKVSEFEKQFSLFFETNKLNPTQKGFFLRGTASDNINQLGHTETNRSLHNLA
jgi:hypothetical protein